MSNKQFNARMQQKIDTYENWSKATNFIPLKGELIIYTTDENGNEKIGFKVGTGEPDKNVHQLDFISLGEANDIGGGLTEVSWEDIKNKPFDEINNSVVWDGIIADDQERVLEDEDAGFYKISDTYCDADALIGKTVNIFSRETNEIIQTSTITADDIVTGMGENVFGIMVGEMPAILMLSEAGMVGEIEFPSAGTWFMSTPEMFVGFLEITQIKQLDKKFIPSDIGTWAGMPDKPFGEEGLQIVWDGTPTKYEPIDVRDTLGCMCYKVGEKLEKDDIIGCTITMSEDIDPIVVDSSMIIDFNDKTFAVMYNGNTPVLFVASERNTVDLSIFGLVGQTLEVPFDGLWFYLFNDGRFTQSILSPDYEIKQIDKKYIPDDIGSGGGVTSWNNLTDKPFYEEKAFEDIIWDGNIQDYETISQTAGGMTLTFCKVFDKYLTDEDLQNSEITSSGVLSGLENDKTESVSAYEKTEKGSFAINGALAASISEANDVVYFSAIGMSITFPSPGIWFIATDAFRDYGYTKSIKTSNITIKQLDEKFIPDVFIKSAAAGAPNGVATLDDAGKVPLIQLPDGIGGGLTEVNWEDIKNKPFYETGFKIEWDGTPTDVFNDDLVNIIGMMFYKVSEPLTIDEIVGSTIKIILNGEEHSLVISNDNIIPLNDKSYLIMDDNGQPYASVSLEATSANLLPIIGQEVFFNCDVGGLWFMYSDENNRSLSLTSPDYELKQIDPKFIPNAFYEKGTKITWDGAPTDTYVQPGQRIEWDGTDTGVSLAVPASGDGTIPEGITLYKVAEKLDSLEGWTYTIGMADGAEGESYFLDSDNIGTVLDDNGNIIATYGTLDAMWVWNVEQVAPVPIMGIEVTFPETGLYFTNFEGQFRISKIWNSAYDAIGDVKIYKIQEPLSGVLNGYKLNITINGEKQEIIISSPNLEEVVYGETDTGSSYGAPFIFNIMTDNETLDFTDDFGFSDTFPTAGLYLIDVNSLGVTFNYLVSPDYELVKIDEKFLPSIEGSKEIYSGVLTLAAKDDTTADLVLLNYQKALSSGGSSLEDLYSLMLYNDISREEFIFQTNPFANSDIVTTKFEYIRIGIGTSFKNSSDMNTVICNQFIEIQARKLDLKNHYTIYCYKNSKYDNLYTGVITGGITPNIENGVDLPVSSNAVYQYINNLGLNSEELEDTRIKANTRANWAENDPQSIAYIENRLVYDAKFHDTIIMDTMPIHNNLTSFGSATIYSTPCEYRRLTFDYIDNALEFAQQISSFYFNKTSYPGRYYNLIISGNEKFATIKYRRYANDNYPPVLIIKSTSTSSSYSEIIEGIEIPGGWSGVYTLCSTDENYPNMYTSQIYFNTIPHQLSTKYIPTDKEVTQGSTNLISSGAVHTALASVANNLQFDTEPTLNSEKLVKSGGIAAALAQKVDNTSYNETINEINTNIDKKANQTDINTINTKIDTQVSNLTTEINKKASQTDLNIAVSDLITEIGKKANSDNVYSKIEIDGLITGAFHYQGSVDTFAELPTNAKVGDTYNVKTADVENNVKAGDNVVWCEIDGIGYWDILSGIVDLSAYSTSEEVQDKLDEKANTTELSKVAKSNDYFDLDNKPCYFVGVDQTVIGSRAYHSNDNLYYPYRYPKKSEYNFEKTVQDYIDGFVSYSFGSDASGFTVFTDNNWIIKDSGIAVYLDNSTPVIFIVPADGLSYVYSSNTTFMFNAGIYCLVDITTISSNQFYVKEVKFETKYIPLDINYLPQHNHTVLEITNIQDILSSYTKTEDVNNSLANKVDVDPNARLMTNSEASKLANIEENANNYKLPAATTTTLGGVKVGDNLSISEDGTISATSLDWDNIDGKPELYNKEEVYNKDEVDSLHNNINTILNNKVDKVINSRLITNDEVNKLAALNAEVAKTNKYSDLDNIPCLLIGVDEHIIWNGDKENKVNTQSCYKISDIEKNKTLSDYANSFKYFLISNGMQITSDTNNFRNYIYTQSDQEIGCFYAYSSNSTDAEFFIALYDNVVLGGTTFPEAGIYSYYNKSDNTYVSEIKFEGQFTPLKSGYLPIATTDKIGGVKVGDNLSISEDGTISATSLDWDNVQGKPTTFTPSEHNHDNVYYTESEINTKVNTLQTNINSVELGLQSSINTTRSDLESSINTTKSDLESSINTTRSDLESSINTTRSDLESSINTKQNISNLVTSIDENSTDTQYPSAKLLYDICGAYDTLLDEITALIGGE